MGGVRGAVEDARCEMGDSKGGRNRTGNLEKFRNISKYFTIKMGQRDRNHYGKEREPGEKGASHAVAPPKWTYLKKGVEP